MSISTGTSQPAYFLHPMSARDGPGTVGSIPGALSVKIKIKLGGLARRFTAYSLHSFKYMFAKYLPKTIIQPGTYISWYFIY